jgi:serine/threonine protein kinase/tetratricopeptide (TPR) repeat protein
MRMTVQPASGARFGRYEIVGPIGSGGMGDVFSARDARLDRDVAIKILPGRYAGDAIALARFEREARAIAALSHPNILAIYDVGGTGGAAYIVTELLRGRTLLEILAGGPLPRSKAIEIASAIALGLAAAHQRGIVHRDLKPANVFVTEDGRVKILDFGLAGRLDPAESAGGSNASSSSYPVADPNAATPASAPLTEGGAVFGTAGYMSPEQVRGEDTDARSDIFSLGAVLYEMCTGRRAFRGRTVGETMNAVLHADPHALTEEIASPGLRRILRHCLEKNPAERFQSAHDVALALKATDASRWSSDGIQIDGRTPDAPPSVAVLPFQSLGADAENEVFAEGMTEDVIASLSRIRALRVISRTSAMRFKGREESLPAIALALGATAILDGSVRRSGNRMRIVVQLVDAKTDRHIWAQTYDRELTDIFAIQSDVALQIAAALKATLSAGERTRIRREPTTDLHAYALYLQGRRLLSTFTEEGLRQSISFFERAIEIDPSYALAWTGVGMAYTELGEIGALRPDEAARRSREAATTALAIDPDLAEAHCILGQVLVVFDFDWEGAEREYRRALELSPNAADAYDLYGRLCSALGRYDDALELERTAHELDPLVHRSDVATTLLRTGRLEEALVEAERCLELDPRYDRGHATLGWVYLEMRRFAEGVAELEKTVALSADNAGWLAQLGQAYALAGRTDRALEVLARLEDLSLRRYVSPYHFAYVHVGLGDEDGAMDCLEMACEERSGAVYGVRGSFLFASLKCNPRFLAMLERMNLTGNCHRA